MPKTEHFGQLFDVFWFWSTIMKAMVKGLTKPAHPVSGRFPKASLSLPEVFGLSWAQCYKTFFIRNLRIFVIS